MLLTRVAHYLYWMGRYIERAENTGRQLQFTYDIYLELSGIAPKDARSEWRHFLKVFPAGDAAPILPQARSSVLLAFANSYLLDPKNDVSVVSTLGKARENARAVNETLTREVYVSINDTYRRLNSLSSVGFSDESEAIDYVTELNRDIQSMLGAIELTLTRDQGWCYQKLGEAMERTNRTVGVMAARLPSLMNDVEADAAPVHYAKWRSLLTNLGSLENYRQLNGPRFTEQQVISFLLFNAGAPRSVLCGLKRMQGYLNQLPKESAGLSLARKLIGKLAARLEYDRDEILEISDLTPFLMEVSTSLNRAHDAIINADTEF
ncbi:MAG: alpha-E domain-containing protein [Fimbriimonadaceae bacterium]|nr:alpha-E domain-containing protein [Fimbriimonadaceae bacterium]